MSILRLLIVSGLLLAAVQAQENEFNTQVMARVMERLEDFMKIPVQATARSERLRRLGNVFPHSLRGKDRDNTLQYLYSEDPVTLYYGLEDGTFIIHAGSFEVASYREPGESGYSVLLEDDDRNERPSFLKENFYHTCVDRATGTPQNCTMAEGTQYIKCQNNCELNPCGWDEAMQYCAAKHKTSDEPEQKINRCLEMVRANATEWCASYTVETVTEEQVGRLGFVPRTYSCLNRKAQFEEEIGKAIGGGNCTFQDGITLVNRSHIAGEYAYCSDDGEDGVVCDGIFTGGFRSRDYDPRFRGWYKLSRSLQRNAWSDLKMGVSYTQPMYNDVVNPDDPLAIPTKEFYGVWAVDYSLAQLTDFLTSQYNSTEMWVVVVETEFPHYVIAASTGSPASVKRMGGDLNTPCPEGATEEDGCQVVRVPIDVLGAETNLAGDIVLKRGFTAYQESGYPDVTELVGFKESETVGVQAFVGQGHIYEQNDASNLQWYVMVAMPMARSIEDAVLSGTSGFVIVCVLATIGVVGCFSLFLILMEKRNEEAFINGDWRFTSAFILGCSALNLSTYTLLGDNTGATCKLRMWFFNGLFALAMSPILVKVWRMYMIIKSSKRFARLKISNFQAWLLTMPIPVAEVIILFIFSFADPPQPMEALHLEDNSGLQTVTCGHETNAFAAVQLSFHAILILMGCVLAYLSRNLDPKYGEAKQLGFAMYNIAFTGIIIVTILATADVDRTGSVILQAIGVLWGTLFSAVAFVFPRLLEVHRAKKSSASRKVSMEIRKYLKKTEEWNSRMFELSNEFGLKATAAETEGVTSRTEDPSAKGRDSLLGREESVNIEKALENSTGRIVRPERNFGESVATEFMNGKDHRRDFLLRRTSSWNAGKSTEFKPPNQSSHK